MTLCGFCVVAALSSQASGLPCTRCFRIGKSLRTTLTSNARGPCEGTDLLSACRSRKPAAELPRFCSRPGKCDWRIDWTNALKPVGAFWAPGTSCCCEYAGCCCEYAGCCCEYAGC